MRETDWLEPLEEQDAAPRRPRPLLLGLAGLPWLLVAALVLLPGRIGPDPAPGPAPAANEDPAPEAAPSPPSPEPPGAPDPAPDADPAPDGDPAPDEVGTVALAEVRGRWRVEPGLEEAASLAVVTARAWLTGADPVLELAGLAPADQAYAEHLVVEAIEQPAGDAVVVTMVAVVLAPDAEEGFSPTVRRLAVPIALTWAGPRIAGSPWDLPPPDLDPIVLPREPLDDAHELQAAHEALVDAGLGDRHLVALHRTPGWPVIAETTADGSPDRHEVWLRRHLGGFVVSGTTLAGDVRARSPAPTDPDVDADIDPAVEPEPGSEPDTDLDLPTGATP